MGSGATAVVDDVGNWSETVRWGEKVVEIGCDDTADAETDSCDARTGR